MFTMQERSLVYLLFFSWRGSDSAAHSMTLIPDMHPLHHANALLKWPGLHIQLKAQRKNTLCLVRWPLVYVRACISIQSAETAAVSWTMETSDAAAAH